MERDPVGYLRYLETSTDPQAVAVRQKIEAGPADLARAREAMGKEGVPLEAAALQKPLPPPDQNAAPLYEKLAQLLKDKPLHLPAYAEPLASTYAYTPAQLAIVQKIYDSRPDVWDLAHQAADKPQCVFARDWTKGPALLFPELTVIREAARLINTETFLLAAQGKYADAVKNQTRGFRIAEHGASDPTLISFLVGVACDALALRGMQNILILAGPNADVDAQVGQAIGLSRARLSLRYALGGEVAGMQEVNFQQMRGSLDKLGISGLAAMLSQQNGETPPAMTGETTTADQQFTLHWLDASEAGVLDAMLPLIAAGDLPPLPRRQVFSRAAATMTSHPKTALTLLADILLPVFDTVDEKDTQRQAWEAVILASAAVMAARAKDGVFPDALPGTFPDPFTDKSLGYRREGTGGVVIYSAGSDGTFSGGKPGDKTPPGQVLFRFPGSQTPATAGHAQIARVTCR